MIGSMFQHKNNPSTKCVVTASTKRGFQVKVTEKNKRPKQQYFYSIDFHPDKGIWKQIQG